MNLRSIVLLIASLIAVNTAKAQTKRPDSLALAKTLHEILRICRSVDFADPKVTELGRFYKAAPFIVYRGEDQSRKWKDIANYSLPEDKKGVDEVCERINRTANQDSLNYRIIKYHTETESEGTWHVLLVNYTRKGTQRTTAYAFLKIGNKFALGDVD